MANPPYDTPSQVQPIDGEVVVIGPGATGLSVTPEAARQTAARLTRAAEQADDGHVEQIDPTTPKPSPAGPSAWARRSRRCATLSWRLAAIVKPWRCG